MFPELEAVIIGEGYERDRLEALRHQVGADRWLHMPGRLSDDEVKAWYRRAWVVAATSLREGWGMTLTEAAACGTPAVATRIAGHLDAVIDETTGLLADGVENLVDAFERVLGDESLRRRLGAPRAVRPLVHLGRHRELDAAGPPRRGDRARLGGWCEKRVVSVERVRLSRSRCTRSLRVTSVVAAGTTRRPQAAEGRQESRSGVRKRFMREPTAGSRWSSCRALPGAAKVRRSCEQVEVGVDLGGAAYAGSPSSVLAVDEMSELALDLGTGGTIVVVPGLFGLVLAGAGESLFVGADPDGAPTARWCTWRRSGQLVQASPK